MDIKSAALLLSVNFLAIALLATRLDKQGLISLDQYVPHQLLGEPCGLGRHEVFAVTSSRLVFSSGSVGPGAGTPSLVPQQYCPIIGCALTVMFVTTCSALQS